LHVRHFCGVTENKEVKNLDKSWFKKPHYLCQILNVTHCGPGVDSASNRNEYQESFLGVKTAGA
jgi:hypothetical protein